MSRFCLWSGSSACDVLLANYVIKTALGAKREVRQILVQVIVHEVQISVLFKRAIHMQQRACVEIKLDAERILTRLIAQWHWWACRGRFLKAATRGWLMQAQSHSCLQCHCTSITVNLQVQWHHWAVDTPGGSNERLADVGTHKCYICKVIQYLTCPETFVRAFM